MYGRDRFDKRAHFFVRVMTFTVFHLHIPPFYFLSPFLQGFFSCERVRVSSFRAAHVLCDV